MVCLFWHSMYIAVRFNVNHKKIHEFSQIIHCWKEDELLPSEYVRIMRIHQEFNDFHDSASANPDHFPIQSEP